MSAGMSSSECKLFIGNMPGDVTIAEIEAAFSQFGSIVEVHIMDGSRSKSGQSSAFVRFGSMEACNNAILGMHMKGKLRPTDADMLVVKFAKAPSVRLGLSEATTSAAVLSDTLRISSKVFDKCAYDHHISSGSTTAASSPSSTPLPSPIQSSNLHLSTVLQSSSRSTKVFVGGLPSYVNRDDLIAIFCPFGRVESVHLMNNNKSKSGQSCAFVNYYAKESAVKAMDALNGSYVIEDPTQPNAAGTLTVRFADCSEDKYTAGKIALKRQKLSSESSGSVCE